MTEKWHKKAILLFLCAGILTGLGGCSGSVSRKVDELRDSGYVIEQTDNGFYITENGTDYYFERGLTGSFFKKAILEAHAKNDDRKATVTITKLGHNRMSVRFISPYLDSDGKLSETGNSADFYFKFKNDFNKENMTNNSGFHDMAGDYQSMTDSYLTPEEIKNIYDRGLDLEKEIRA